MVAGLLASMREMTLLYAPNINSYKRYQPGTFAPTAVRWGVDNRTCSLRVVGHGPSMRVENRVPGGDVNPYLAIAGMVAGAPCTAWRTSWIWSRPRPATPTTTPTRLGCRPRCATRSSCGSGRLARQAFGDEVVAHYANNARVELAAFDAAVTDWELFRGFERL